MLLVYIHLMLTKLTHFSLPFNIVMILRAVLECSFYDDSLFSLSRIKGAFHFLYILQNTFLLFLFIK